MIDDVQKDGECTLVFPNQLFKDSESLSIERPVFLIEEPIFFNQSFNKKKLMLHRASMRAYMDLLMGKGYDVHYIDYVHSAGREYLVEPLICNRIKRAYFADPLDNPLKKKLVDTLNAEKIKPMKMGTNAFLTPEQWIRDFFSGLNHYSMAKFYIAQRKRLKIMLREDGGPIGGKWSYDMDNRKPILKTMMMPTLAFPITNAYVRDAARYVDKLFPEAIGNTKDFFIPVTHIDAEKWLIEFLENRLINFGDYEDSISKDQPLLFHSLLSSMLNIGLLKPSQVLEKTQVYAESHPERAPLNSLEGFIRQLIGWREFMRAVYILEGEKERSSNFWKHTRRMPRSLYTGTTGIDPIDKVTARVIKSGYAHHIERLMILGNFMFLCELDPGEVYSWFMENFIDSYDWVMVPNVFGMSQYSDGGLITTKPYISSSNYLLKMSDFEKGPWCRGWDSLYWRFISKNRAILKENPRMGIIVSKLDSMNKETLNAHLKNAEEFLGKFALL